MQLEKYYCTTTVTLKGPTEKSWSNNWIVFYLTLSNRGPERQQLAVSSKHVLVLFFLLSFILIVILIIQQHTLPPALLK